MKELIGKKCQLWWIPAPKGGFVCNLLKDTMWATVIDVSEHMIKLDSWGTVCWCNINLISTIRSTEEPAR